MKIVYCSDIHNEFLNSLGLFATVPECDVLVIAGDLNVTAYKTIEDLINISYIATNVRNYIIYVPGNHEFYGSSYREEWEIFNEEHEVLTKHKIVLLDNNNFVIGGQYNFIGVIGWPDHSFKQIDKIVHSKYKDFKNIKDFPNHHKRLGLICKEYVESALSDSLINIVISHWLPIPRCVSERYRQDWLTPCFVNDWSDIVINNDIALWIHGHSHVSHDEVHFDTRFVRHPLGYVEKLKGNKKPTRILNYKFKSIEL